MRSAHAACPPPGEKFSLMAGGFLRCRNGMVTGACDGGQRRVGRGEHRFGGYEGRGSRWEWRAGVWGTWKGSAHRLETLPPSPPLPPQSRWKKVENISKSIWVIAQIETSGASRDFPLPCPRSSAESLDAKIDRYISRGSPQRTRRTKGRHTGTDPRHL